MRRAPLAFAEDHPAFSGHFPGNPILPGVALLDAALLDIATDCGLDLAECQLAVAKFQAFVRPGAALALESERRADGSIRFAIHGDDALVASGILLTPATKTPSP